MDRNPGLSARQAKHAARVSHQQRGSRILIGGIELFDYHHSRLRLRDHFADALMELAQALFERVARIRNDDTGLDQADAAVGAFDRAVSGGAQCRIESENTQRSSDQGAGVPLTITVTAEPGLKGVPALGCVPTTFPSVPTLVVYCHFETE